MVQGSEKKKTVINITSIQKGFESRRTVVKPRFLMERHEDIGKERAKRGLEDYPWPRNQSVDKSDR